MIEVKHRNGSKYKLSYYVPGCSKGVCCFAPNFLSDIPVVWSIYTRVGNKLVAWSNWILYLLLSYLQVSLLVDLTNHPRGSSESIQKPQQHGF